MASSAVRTALKVGASLIVVLSHTSTAARLVAKYRPAQPVLALMVPRLAVRAGVKWKLEGRGEARRCLMSRGLAPLLWWGGAGGWGLGAFLWALSRIRHCCLVELEPARWHPKV
jgi:pyruvate kinase